MNAPIRIMLVEDNVADADLVKETLEAGGSDLQVVSASDGVEALETLMEAARSADGLPALVLLDLNLPRMNGQTVLAEMRANPSLRRIPVIVLTSSDARHDITRSYELGANCYVTKPIGLEAFQRMLSEVRRFWLAVAKIP